MDEWRPCVPVCRMMIHPIPKLGSQNIKIWNENIEKCRRSGCVRLSRQWRHGQALWLRMILSRKSEANNTCKRPCPPGMAWQQPPASHCAHANLATPLSPRASRPPTSVPQVKSHCQFVTGGRGCKPAACHVLPPYPSEANYSIFYDIYKFVLFYFRCFFQIKQR